MVVIKFIYLSLISKTNIYIILITFHFLSIKKKNLNQKKLPLIFNLNIIHSIHKKLKTCINKKKRKKEGKEPQEQASKKQLSAEVTSIEWRIAFRVIGSRCSNKSPR